MELLKAFGIGRLVSAVLLGGALWLAPTGAVMAQDTTAEEAVAPADASADTAPVAGEAAAQEPATTEEAPADAATGEEAAPVEEAPAEEPAPPVFNSGDTAWMMTSTALVLMMTIPGLALFYGGMVRKKNVLATTVQSFGVCALVTVLWMVVGYSIAFTHGGELNAYVGGLKYVLLSGLGPNSFYNFLPNIPESVWMTFQMTFAIITPALIAGAFAERMKFASLLWFKGLWLLLVYAPIAHWVWYTHDNTPEQSGFLFAMGVLDFAGGAVVHLNAGIAGLVCALVMGPRTGYRTGSDGQNEALVPHNLVLTLIGASLLWVGWFGFNAGSAGAANGLAGIAMANTQVATGAAAMSWMFAEWLFRGKPSVLGLLSGAVAGLVAITPAAGFVLLDGALYIGLASGVVCMLSSVFIKRWAGYDDSLDAFGIHGVGGALGAILTGVFASPAVQSWATGLLYGNPGQVMIQLKGLGIVALYSAVMTFLILMVIRLTIGLRVDQSAEEEGLDVSLHGESVH